MLCNKCNKEINNNSKFCEYCGNKIFSINKSDDNIESKIMNNQENNGKSSKNRLSFLKDLLLLLVVVIITIFVPLVGLFIIVMGVIFAPKSANSNEAESKTSERTGIIVIISIFLIGIVLYLISMSACVDIINTLP